MIAGITSGQVPRPIRLAVDPLPAALFEHPTTYRFVPPFPRGDGVGIVVHPVLDGDGAFDVAESEADPRDGQVTHEPQRGFKIGMPRSTTLCQTILSMSASVWVPPVTCDGT